MSTVNPMGTVLYATVYQGEVDGVDNVDAVRLPSICALPVEFDDDGQPEPQESAVFEDPTLAVERALGLADQFPGSIYEVWEVRVVAAAVDTAHAELAFTEDPNAETFLATKEPSVSE